MLSLDFKSLLHRITSLIPDTEEKTQELIRDMIKSLYLSHSDNFWSIWNSLKISEQHRINNLFGNNIAEHRELLGEIAKSDYAVILNKFFKL